MYSKKITGLGGVKKVDHKKEVKKWVAKYALFNKHIYDKETENMVSSDFDEIITYHYRMIDYNRKDSPYRR